MSVTCPNCSHEFEPESKQGFRGCESLSPDGVKRCELPDEHKAKHEVSWFDGFGKKHTMRWIDKETGWA